MRQLFEPLIASLPRAERAALFDGAAGVAATLLGAQSPAGAAPPAGELFALLHGLHWLTAGLAARGPLLLALDDAHWADGPSLRFAHYLARRLDELPVLLVLTVRSTAPEAPAPLVDAIAGEPVASTIRPKPLSTSGAAVVLRELFATEPHEEFVRASHEASSGNPFLLTELARALDADGRAPDVAACARIRDVRPEAIARNALVRLGHLGPAARDVARAVATLGDDAELRHVASLAGLSDDGAADAVDGLVAAGLLAEGRPVRYMHPLTRAVVYEDLGQAGRARLHKRAAAMLADEAADPERVAAHLLWTEPSADERVVDRLLRAAARAQRQGAVDAVGAYMRRALAEPPPAHACPAVLLELGRAESAAAQPEAGEHLLQAFALSDDAGVRGDIAEAAAPFLLSSGRTSETLELLDTVIGEVAGHDPERALQLDALFVAAAMLDPRAVHEAAGHIERVGEDLRGASRGERMMLCQLSYHRAWRSQDAGRAVELARRALGDGALIADRGVVPFELIGPLSTLICADELAAAAAVLDDAVASARRHGSEHAFSFVCSQRARRGLSPGLDGRGRERGARRAGRDAEVGAAARQRGQHRRLDRRARRAGTARRGRRVAAGDRLRRRADPATGAVQRPARRARPAARGARRHRGGARRSRGVRTAQRGLRDAQPAHVRMADRRGAGAARAWRAGARPRARGAGARGVACRGARRGRSAALSASSPCSRTTSARLIAGLGRAVELLAASPARLEHARALADLGAAQRRANRRTEARETLRSALDMARRCGATALAERAHGELLATGARPRRTTCGASTR